MSKSLIRKRHALRLFWLNFHSLQMSWRTGGFKRKKFLYFRVAFMLLRWLKVYLQALKILYEWVWKGIRNFPKLISISSFKMIEIFYLSQQKYFFCHFPLFPSKHQEEIDIPFSLCSKVNFFQLQLNANDGKQKLLFWNFVMYSRLNSVYFSHPTFRGDLNWRLMFRKQIRFSKNT